MNDLETRKAVTRSLAAFAATPLADAAIALFESLGYRSQKRITLKPNSPDTFVATFVKDKPFNSAQALLADWVSVDFLFQLTDDEIRAAAQGNQQFLFESKGQWNGAEMNSYLFLAVTLKQPHYSRTELSRITRAVNRLFSMPALLLFRHGDTLTLAVINRRLHKHDPSKDVLEKVTLIKDIRFANPHRAHIEILCDLSFDALREKHDFSNFVALHAAWQKTLDSSELNKRFFIEVANWYFWALNHIEFPRDAPKQDDKDHISVIRLITRLMFCWFIKEKGLLPDVLFDERKLPEILDGFAPSKITDKASVFYRAILQNLFFATLNTEMDKRGWTKEEQNFMAHSLYRFRESFQKPAEALDLFKNIPFLNGGLFECLDKDLGEKASPRYQRVDGFSRRADSQVVVPDFLFFGSERDVDLSAEYGDNKFKKVKIRGLIHILNHYKFTVAENTPIEEEIALDPELSGKVFENLLAAYNPETGASARKQTGSFYTPREVVNYMVDEALIASLRTKLETALQSAKDVETRLRHLFAYNNAAHQFTAPEVDALIAAIDGLKSLDPAVGSGAFPMGILHKLVFILGKLDPDNTKWRERQRQRAIEQTAEAFKIGDQDERQRRLEDINGVFEQNASDYGRKLYLIENCIYGVDIQPIAVQIAKMRFFISLIVDQKIDDTQQNRGVRPLPNLETKFVAANALVGVIRPGQQLLRNREIDTKETELRRVRERHFLARTPKQKAKCRDDDARLRVAISELLKGDGWDTATARRLASWNPYDQNAAADFFDPEWMFGILDGFAVLIGNPPYLKERDNKTVFDAITSTAWGEKYHEGKMDYWFFFLHRALEEASSLGIVSFITSRYWLNSAGSKKLVAHIRKDAFFFHIVDIGDLPVFEQVAGHHMLHFYRVGAKQSGCLVIRLQNSLEGLAYREESDNLKLSTQVAGKLFTESGELRLYASGLKLRGETTLGNHFEVTQGVVQNPDKVSGVMARRFGLPKGAGVFVLSQDEIDGLQLNTVEKQFIRPFYDEAAVGRFHLDRRDPDCLIYLTKKNCPTIEALTYLKQHLQPFKEIMDARRETLNGTISWFQLHWPRDPRFFESSKVVLPSMFSSPNCAYVAEPPYFGMGSNVVVGGTKILSLKLLCAVLNSKVALWWFCTNGKQRGVGVDIGVDRLRQFPLPNIETPQTAVESLVDQILGEKRKNPAAKTSALEREIDQHVYALYGLTPEEIKIVEGAAK